MFHVRTGDSPFQQSVVAVRVFCLGDFLRQAIRLRFQTTYRNDINAILWASVCNAAYTCKYHKERGLIHFCRIQLIFQSCKTFHSFLNEGFASKFDFNQSVPAITTQ